MPKPELIAEQQHLENDMIETLLAGLKQWRPDLSYPESHSDMQACVRGLLMMYDIKRKPLPELLKHECSSCEGLGHLVVKADGFARELQTCKECKGRGYMLGA